MEIFAVPRESESDMAYIFVVPPHLMDFGEVRRPAENVIRPSNGPLTAAPGTVPSKTEANVGQIWLPFLGKVFGGQGTPKSWS